MGPATTIQEHFRLAEAAKLLHLPYETTRQLFIREPGVVRLRHHGAGIRTRSIYLIPAAVIERVLRRNANEPRLAA